MSRAQFFNIKAPAPSDKHIMGLFKEFEALQKEIIANWISDIAEHRLAARGFVDLASARMRIATDKRAHHPIITINPVMGFDTLDEFNLYVDIFTLYGNIRDKLIAAIQIVDRLMTGKPVEGVKETEVDAMLARMRTGVHILTMLLKALVFAANNHKLERYHLDVLTKETDLTALDTIIRSFNIDFAFPIGFKDGDPFFKNPDQLWVAAFYRYVQKLDKVNPEKPL
jgi:hypothetical protein